MALVVEQRRRRWRHGQRAGAAGLGAVVEVEGAVTSIATASSSPRNT
jgi:hypothetical protein